MTETITRRALLAAVALAPLALTACQFWYDVSELAGHYRAEGSRISERLTLHPGGVYFHTWRANGEERLQLGAWRLGANWIYCDDFVSSSRTLPAPLTGGAEVVFIPGPPTYFFWGAPRFFSRELDLLFVWQRGL